MQTYFRAMSKREEEKCSLVTDKDSLKTKQATKFAVSTLRQYLVEKGHNENFEDFDRETLDKTLRIFYSEMRNAKGESYKRSSLLAIRSGLARFLASKRQLDIINDSEFKSSCEMFVSMLKAVSREGNGGIDHKLAICSSDIDCIVLWPLIPLPQLV